jgi:hypothetical protein
MTRTVATKAISAAVSTSHSHQEAAYIGVWTSDGDGCRLGDESFGFDNNQPKKKSNDLKRPITADPKNLDGREKEKGNKSLSEREFGEGSFGENLHLLCFSIFFCRIASTTTLLSVSLAFF